MINFIDKVNHIVASEPDKYGIIIDGETVEDVPCKIFYSLKLEELENTDGKTIKVTAKVYFDGLYHVKFGDKLNFTDVFGVKHTLDVLDIKPIINFSDEIEYTRVTV